jgi:hypothetical protein
MFCFSLLLLFVCVACGHICSVFPPQRGPLSITGPGDDSCFRRVGECGGQPQEKPKTTLRTGVNTVLVQQNLNHWSNANPGFIDVSVSYNPEKVEEQDFQVLTTILVSKRKGFTLF